MKTVSNTETHPLGQAIASSRGEVIVTKRVGFCCAHHYWQPEWDTAKNRTVFDACSNRWGHGHNYELFVKVKGPVEADTGMVMNLNDLKRLLKTEVIEPLDHNYLNHQVPFFSKTIPTLETLVVFLWHRLAPRIEALGLSLYGLTLKETETLSIEYYGEPIDFPIEEALLFAPSLSSDEGALTRAVS
jgi:6-pyruvoyltetrahydropterin/6-carboxytetrahydropterin synthase